MTPIAGLIIAIIAGLIVRNGRRAALVVLVPWAVVLGYQSWYIASGRAVSPPSTVTSFPSAIGYWLVQAIMLSLALGIAAQVGASLSRRYLVGDDPDGLARRAWIASGLSVVASVVVILLGFVWFRQQGGTVFVAHHSSGGSMPVIGTAGLLGLFVGFGVLGLMTLRRRHTAKAERPVRSGQTTITANGR